MKRSIFLSLIVICLALAAAGCGKELCEEAYDKAMECVDNMKCSTADPLQREQCDKNKSAIRQQNETKFKLGCDEAEAQKYVDCALDPLTCLCPG